MILARALDTETGTTATAQLNSDSTCIFATQFPAQHNFLDTNDEHDEMF